jgi:hypothetical protein
MGIERSPCVLQQLGGALRTQVWLARTY